MDYSDAIKNAFREKRFTVREFVFDPSKAGGVDGQIDQAKWEVQQTLTTIVRWCRAHFGEVFSGWVHLKVIKGFVESVLRYGLPVDFLAMFVEPNMKREKQQLDALKAGIGKMRSDLSSSNWEDGEDADKEGGDEADNLPFVFHRFNATAN